MRAVALQSFGGPDVLRLQDWPDPDPLPGRVVIELKAAALNWHDCLLRMGVHRIALPQVIGADGAGIRRDTGEEVVILPSLHWGADDSFPAPEFEILGDRTPGTYAELVAIPEENAFPKPAHLDWRESAALALAGATAFRALFTRGDLRRGETVLVIGGSGGVATVAVALAGMAGARVLVTTSSEQKLERAIELGASAGVLSGEQGWPEQVRELSDGGVDLVLDSVGSTWQQSLAALRGGGRLVSFGASGGEHADIPIRPFYFAQHSILGTTMGSPRDFAGALRLIEEHPRWRPAIHTVLPLRETAAAHALMERHEHVGKIVLDIA